MTPMQKKFNTKVNTLAALGLAILLTASCAESQKVQKVQPQTQPATVQAKTSYPIPDPRRGLDPVGPPIFKTQGENLVVLRERFLYLVGGDHGHTHVMSRLELPDEDAEPRRPRYTELVIIDNDIALVGSDASCNCLVITKVRNHNGNLSITGTTRVAGMDWNIVPSTKSQYAQDKAYVLAISYVSSRAEATSTADGIKQFGDPGAPPGAVAVTRLAVDLNGNLERMPNDYRVNLLVCEFSRDVPDCSLRMLESSSKTSSGSAGKDYVSYIQQPGAVPMNALALLPFDGGAAKWVRINENFLDSRWYGPLMMGMSDGSVLAIVDKGARPATDGANRFELARYVLKEGVLNGAVVQPVLTPLPGAELDASDRLFGYKRLYYWSQAAGTRAMNSFTWKDGRVDFAEPLLLEHTVATRVKKNGILFTELVAGAYQTRCAAPANGSWRHSTYAGAAPAQRPVDIFNGPDNAKFDVIGLLEGGEANQRKFDSGMDIQVLTCEAGTINAIGKLHLSDFIVIGKHEVKFQIGGNFIYAIMDSKVNAFEIKTGSTPALVSLGQVAVPSGFAD